MIPVEGSSSGGITNWAAVSMDDMMRYVTRNLEPHWRQAEGWRKTNELMWLHADRLNQYLEHLARVWNPDTSPASQAYREKLNELVVSVKNVQDVAGENVTYANDIPRSLGETFAKMQPVYQMYVFERSRPTSSPADEAARRAHMLMLETQARAIMYALGAALNSSGSRFQEPKPYQAPKPVSKDGNSDYGSDSNSHALPLIPPVTTQQPTQTQPPPGQVRPFPTNPTGPDLSGLNPQQPFPTGPTGPTPGPGTGPAPGGPGPYPGMPPGGVIGGGPGGTGPGGVPRPTTPGGMVGGAVPAGARGGAMPPGGVIGGAGARGAGGVGGMRPNPPGGVIGGAAPRGPMSAGTAGVRPGAGAGGVAGRGPVGGPLGGVHGGRSGDEDGEQFDPDTQWAVNEGVAPVVDSPETPDQIDPGPAIGLNR